LGAGSLKISSFNGQGILCTEGAKRQRKLAHVSSLASDRHAICLQELHGKEGEILSALQSALPHWLIIPSGFCDAQGLSVPGAGGAAICLSPKVLLGVSKVEPIVLVSGRCMAVTLYQELKSFTIVNIHNSSLTVDQVKYIRGFLKDLRMWDRDHPTQATSLLVGDLNFMGVGDRRFKAGRPIDIADNVTQPSGSAHYGLWNSELKSWVEVVQPFPTHFAPSSASSGRIDRAWLSASSPSILQMTITSAVGTPPEILYNRCISDHGVLDVVFAGRVKKSDGELPPISKEICKMDVFGELLDTYFSALDVFSLPEERQLHIFNITLREIGRIVRDKLITTMPNSEESISMVCASISRAVWGQNLVTARKLLRSSPLAREHLRIVNNRCEVIDMNAFDELFNANRLAERNRAIASMQAQLTGQLSTNSKKQIRSKMQAARRSRSLHWPSHKMLKLSGIRTHDGNVTTPSGMQHALKLC